MNFRETVTRLVQLVSCKFFSNLTSGRYAAECEDSRRPTSNDGQSALVLDIILRVAIFQLLTARANSEK